MRRTQKRNLIRAVAYTVVVVGLITVLVQAKRSLDADYVWRWETFFDVGLPLLWSGLWRTLALSAICLVCALPLGIAIGLCRTARDPGARAVGFVYVEIVRGTPLLVQVLLWYFVIGRLFRPLAFTGFNLWLADFDGMPELLRELIVFDEGGLNSFQSAVCALSCFTASYIAEIVRAGIQSIDRGQMEAARSLGLSHAQAMRKVILPQALRRVLPPLASEFIALVKDSSLAYAIGYEELTKRAFMVEGKIFTTFEQWLIVALLYLSINVTLSFGVRILEIKLGTETQRGAIR